MGFCRAPYCSTDVHWFLLEILVRIECYIWKNWPVCQAKAQPTKQFLSLQGWELQNLGKGWAGDRSNTGHFRPASFETPVGDEIKYLSFIFLE